MSIWCPQDGSIHQRAEPGAFPGPVQRPAVFCVATVLAEETHGGAAGADETIRHLGAVNGKDPTDDGK